MTYRTRIKYTTKQKTDIWDRWQRGAIDESRLRSALGPVQFDSPLVRRYWDENKRFFANEYRDYIDELMRSHDLESSSQ